MQSQVAKKQRTVIGRTKTAIVKAHKLVVFCGSCCLLILCVAIMSLQKFRLDLNICRRQFLFETPEARTALQRTYEAQIWNREEEHLGKQEKHQLLMANKMLVFRRQLLSITTWPLDRQH